MRLPLALALVALLLSSTFDARADLIDDVARLTNSYRQAGAKVELMPAQFLIAGETRRLELLDLRDDKRGCLSVVALSARPLSFSVRAALPQGLRLRARATRSEAGAAMLVDCGKGPLSTGGIELIMGPRRGAVELLVAAHERRLTSVDVVLVERAVGPVAQQGQVAGALALAPLEQRVRRAVAAATRDGAQQVVRVPTRSDERGVQSLSLRLRNGCHRIAVLAKSGGPRAVDIDAEIRMPGADHPLRQDRAHAPDARLDFCIGEDGPVELRFAGAGGAVDVMVLAGYWPHPPGLPSGWGAQATAGLAWALHRRRAPSVSERPLTIMLGAPGSTVVPIDVEPGACYLAAFAVADGKASAAQLSVKIGADVRHDEAGELPRAAAVTFCAGPRDRSAEILIQLRAQSAWWLLPLWRLT